MPGAGGGGGRGRGQGRRRGGGAVPWRGRGRPGEHLPGPSGIWLAVPGGHSRAAMLRGAAVVPAVPSSVVPAVPPWNAFRMNPSWRIAQTARTARSGSDHEVFIADPFPGGTSARFRRRRPARRRSARFRRRRPARRRSARFRRRRPARGRSARFRRRRPLDPPPPARSGPIRPDPARSAPRSDGLGRVPAAGHTSGGVPPTPRSRPRPGPQLVQPHAVPGRPCHDLYVNVNVWYRCER